MQLYPAIDVQGGRLARGSEAADVVRTAEGFGRAGATWIHVVDLDRVAGSGRNDEVVRSVAALPGLRIQLGGALTVGEDLAQALEWGVARVVLGEAATGNLASLLARFGPGQLALTVEVRSGVPTAFAGGRVRTSIEAVVERAVAEGVRTIVYRDAERDGTLVGADFLHAPRALGRGADVVLAGGVATLDEVRRARDLGFAGVIVGRALLDGRFTLSEALACCG